MDIETVLGDFAAAAPSAAERATFFSTLASNSELQTAVLQAWLPDGDSQIFRSYVLGPSGLKDYGSTTLHCKI